MSIINHRHIFLAVSGLLVLGSFVLIGLWGLRLGIDFTGGSLLEVEYMAFMPPAEEVRKASEPLTGSVVVQPTGERGVIMRFGHIDEPTHQEVLRSLEKLVGEGKTSDKVLVEKRFDTIGPTIGVELKRKSLMALALALLGIVLYIAWAFRKVSKPVSSWKYGVVAIFALVHDIVIPMGFFAAFGHFGGVEVDALFVTALLTTLGFSVHDTIVVFDRIRENLQRLKGTELFAATVGRSVTETIARSVNTSLTVLVVLIAVLLLGGETTRYFALTLIIGITFGTYSSIFVASPLLVIWQQRSARKSG